MMMTKTMFVGGMMVTATLQPAIASYFHPAAWAVKFPTETNIPIFIHPNDSHHHFYHHHHHYRRHHHCQNNHHHHYFLLLSSTNLPPKPIKGGRNIITIISIFMHEQIAIITIIVFIFIVIITSDCL